MYDVRLKFGFHYSIVFGKEVDDPLTDLEIVRLLQPYLLDPPSIDIDACLGLASTLECERVDSMHRAVDTKYI